MTTLGTLPLELVEKIVGFFVEVDEGAPVVGHNAVSIDPYAWINASRATGLDPHINPTQIKPSVLHDLRNLRL